MKVKHLILVSLILAILTIGVVSASEDILSDDELSVSDSIDEFPDDELSIGDSDGDCVIESPNDANELGNRHDDIKTDMELYDEFNTNDDRDDYVALIKADDVIDGTVTLLIDDVQYYQKTFSMYDEEVKIYSYDLNLPDNLKTGNHKVELNYQRNGFPVKTVKRTVDFDYSPILTYLDDISVGETNYVRYLSGVVGRTGSIAAYNMEGDEKGSYITTVAVADSRAIIEIPGTTKGVHKYWFDFNVDGRSFSRTIEVTVHANTPGFEASVTPKIYEGGTATVTFKGPYNGIVDIFIDGKAMKRFRYTGGKASDNLVGLTLGKHQITVQYERGDYFFSKTFDVNVVKKPASLKLDKITVRKSAKKIVLKATLKEGKKALNGKKVTFKFNGKKFKAKTNKKGIAKAVVKNKFFKKLKVGKKVKYQATYLNKTVKKVAKVKK